MTETVTSADGTTIAYERVGSGPALIVLGGAMNTRRSAAGLAALLEQRLTVYTVDRRGRGDSGNTPPWSVEREVDDIAALLAIAGEGAGIYGHSSGGILALEVAAAGHPVGRIAAYEPPFTASDEAPEPHTAVDAIEAALASDNRDAAVRTFMATTGMPPDAIDGMAQSPWWGGLLAVAHTLPYDLGLANSGVVPAARYTAIPVPTLVLDGGDSAPWAARAGARVASVVRGATRMTIAGQHHGVDDAAVAPTLAGFFARS